MATSVEAPKMDHWLPAAGKFFSPPPAEEFNPNRSWQHTYVILDNASIRGGGNIRDEGFLRIRRSALAGDSSGDRFVLDVELLATKQRLGSFRTTIQIESTSDPLSTPQKWKLTSLSLDARGRPVDVTRVEEQGSISNGRITRSGRSDRKLKTSGRVTSNWSLFDAVQRLGGKKIEPLKFDMLEDLDLWKPNQVLSYRGTTELELGGRTIRLVGYQQIGEGILPYHYWLDTSGRLIFAYGGLRSFMFNPDAESLVKKPQPPGRKSR